MELIFVIENVAQQLTFYCLRSHFEQLAKLDHRVVRVFDSMADSSRVLEDLVVVASLVRLVPKEMDRGVVDATRQILFVLDMLQCECLVPASWEDVE